MRFKEALSTKALEENSVLGKLFKKGPREPDRSNVNMADEFKTAKYIEDVKTYRKWIRRNPSLDTTK
jgi:hypothetical protein